MTAEARPALLRVESTHLLGPCFTVALVGEPVPILRYRYEVHGAPDDAHGPIVIDLAPDDEAWRRFRAELDRLDVWSWRPRYELPSPIEGGSLWSLEIGWGERRVASSGENAFPSPGGPEPSADFIAWCRAVRELVGGRPFA